MKNRTLETVVGFVVLSLTVMFIIFGINGASIKNGASYQLIAQFENIDGITIGSEVKISGIKVGNVVETRVTDNYTAEVIFLVSNDIDLPKDSNVKIVSAGLLGGRYLDIVPGADDKVLKDGGEIKYTQSSIILEDLISKFVFKDKSDNE